MYLAGVVIWIAFLVVAAFYTRRARHPHERPLAAYLIFVVIFTTSSFVLFALLTFALRVSGQADVLVHPAAAALFLLVVFGPAFFVARWQLRKPPGQQRQP